MSFNIYLYNNNFVILFDNKKKNKNKSNNGYTIYAYCRRLAVDTQRNDILHRGLIEPRYKSTSRRPLRGNRGKLGERYVVEIGI